MTSRLYHNPTYDKSRKVLRMISKNGEKLRNIDHLKTPLTRAELVGLMASLAAQTQLVLQEKGPDVSLRNPASTNDMLIDTKFAHSIQIKHANTSKDERKKIVNESGQRLF